MQHLLRFGEQVAVIEDIDESKNLFQLLSAEKYMGSALDLGHYTSYQSVNL